MKIAENLTINDWNKLIERLSPDNDTDWEIAFQFFEKRTASRYLLPINILLDNGEDKGEGFAIVNLQCSLIETIESFYNGWIYNNNEFCKSDGLTKAGIVNGDIFISFFNSREPFKSSIPKINGNDFYKNVRCGLLHETQTKNGWKISSNAEKSYDEIPETSTRTEKIINRTLFQRDLETAINIYRSEILHGTNKKELREFFIRKINNICNIS